MKKRYPLSLLVILVLFATTALKSQNLEQDHEGNSIAITSLGKNLGSSPAISNNHKSDIQPETDTINHLSSETHSFILVSDPNHAPDDLFAGIGNDTVYSAQ